VKTRDSVFTDYGKLIRLPVDPMVAPVPTRDSRPRGGRRGPGSTARRSGADHRRDARRWPRPLRPRAHLADEPARVHVMPAQIGRHPSESSRIVQRPSQLLGLSEIPQGLRELVQREERLAKVEPNIDRALDLREAMPLLSRPAPVLGNGGSSGLISGPVGAPQALPSCVPPWTSRAMPPPIRASPQGSAERGPC
jgi:hypothetical protein